jgi:hypothetical protein
LNESLAFHALTGYSHCHHPRQSLSRARPACRPISWLT